jgi:hypothetical protein
MPGRCVSSDDVPDAQHRVPAVLTRGVGLPSAGTGSGHQGHASGRLAGQQPRPELAVVVVAGLAVAVTRALRQGQWMVGGVLAFVGLAAVLCPLADAPISRRAEMAADLFAADLFAADHGLASELAAALQALNDGPSCGSADGRGCCHPTRPLSSGSGRCRPAVDLRP